MTVKASEEVSIKCDADGVPEPVVNWSKDDKPLLAPHFITGSDHRLMLV